MSGWATAGVVPDLVVVLDVPDDVAAARRSAGDRMEREAESFHAEVRAAYRALAKERGWVVVDGSLVISSRAAVAADASTSTHRKHGGTARAAHVLGLVRVVAPQTPPLEAIAVAATVLVGVALDDMRDVLEEDPLALAEAAEQVRSAQARVALPGDDAPRPARSGAFREDLAGRTPDLGWVRFLLERVGLGDHLSRRPGELSGGQQQRAAIARALVARPAIVFADEPTGNLDSESSAEVLGFLRRSVRELGQTVVMVTHDPNAASYADRVLFLADGRIVDEMLDPTADRVLERMKAFDADGVPVGLGAESGA